MAESGKRRRSFPDAFKLETVAAIRDGRSVSAVSAELGLPDRLVRSWLRWAGLEHAPNRGTAGSGAPGVIEPGRSGGGDRAAAARERAAADGARHLKASRAHLRPGDGPERSYGFIRDHVATCPVQLLCEVLGVSRSGNSAWASRPESARAVADRDLAAAIRVSHEGRRGRYGSPRIHAELRVQGRRIGRKRVARLMRGMGLSARRKRRFRRTTDSAHALPVAPNRLARGFTAAAPDHVWLDDLTYIGPAEGWLYLAVMLDLFSRRIVGWAMADHLGHELALAALDMAIARQRPSPGLVHHSDRGVQGGFTWSSQHRGGGWLRWRSGGVRIGACGQS
jgi:transposase-like protein